MRASKVTADRFVKILEAIGYSRSSGKGTHQLWKNTDNAVHSTITFRSSNARSEVHKDAVRHLAEACEVRVQDIRTIATSKREFKKFVSSRK
jgi:predicted RNA binding protein YcfA (HicA-like mRNA interferase family)